MTAVEWLANELYEKFEMRGDGLLYDDILKQAKEMENNYKLKATRVEVIQHSPPYNGRAYTNYNAKNVEIMLQDDGRTLKIFLK